MIRKIHRFDKWSQFMDAVKTNKPNPCCDKPIASRRNEFGETNPWSGAHSFEEALEFLTKGWQDGITRLKGFQQSIPPDLYDCIMPVKEYKPELRHQISGGGLDIAAHLSGATPETFINEVIPHNEGKEVVKGRKLQTVYMNIANSCFTSEKAFFYRGAYTYTMIEHLENCGYSVELWVLNNVTGGRCHQTIYTKVKEFGELFDVNKLVVALCSNFMLRRFMFSIQEQGDNDEVRDIQHKAYGYPDAMSLGEIALPEDMDTANNPIYIGTVNESNPDQMLERFKKILVEFTTMGFTE